MRINETALIPQRAMGIRVGQRGKIKTVAYPTCNKCGVDALYSLTVPCDTAGIKTVHRCNLHLDRTPEPTQGEIVELLVRLGIL